ncbi:MAG TPA: glutathione S-transferase family protein [Parvibaculum sp.]|jgi:glutathione S-transferase
MSDPTIAGMKVYGLDLSYFTGKFEAFLRYKQIPHERIELSAATMRHVARKTGLAQMPAVELPDGRWMSDSTPMIEWLDAAWSGPAVVPAEPLQRFFSQLLEDYADEWLWRPALHYRWSYQPDARLMSHRIADEMLHDMPGPLWLRRWAIYRRQLRKYVHGDGVTAETRAHVEDIYLRNLRWLEVIFTARPFLLGERPTLADFGFFASMFRHFGLDPTPARIMRDEAPHVYEWLGRMWNAKASGIDGALLPGDAVPYDWHPILIDMGRGYLPYLNANARAWREGQKTFTVEIETCRYRLPVHRYRVWCLERLQGLFRDLPEWAAAARLLDDTGCLAPLLEMKNLASGFDPDRRAPFFEPGRVWP